MSSPSTPDVLIVGAGLAGLSAALDITRAGLEPHVIEAADTVGGRVSSESVDGFILDRGFQVLATAYPRVRELVDLGELDLRAFAPGVGVFGGGRVHRLIDPRRDASALREALEVPIGSLADRARLAAYAVDLLRSPAKELLTRPDASADEAFIDRGLSDVAIDRLLRPFLRGVVLEEDLSTSRRFVDLAIRTMLRGPVALPARGMQQLPAALARLLPPGSIEFGVTVESISNDGVVTSQGPRSAAAVIVATDPLTAHGLVPSCEVPAMRSVTTLYHSTTQAPRDDALLVVDGERSLIANTVVMSNVAETYAPAGRSLISTSVLGVGHTPAELDRAVRRRLARMYDADTSSWDTVAVVPVAHAVPAMPAGHDFSRPVRWAPRRYVAGDHRDSGSIQGALASGRRAARAVIDDLGTPH